MAAPDDLYAAAWTARAHAHAPYSGFAVGAAVRGASGRVYAGCNVENAAYPVTICAERVAAAKVAELGERTIVAIAVTAPKLSPVTPCGGCRQVLNEFHPIDAPMPVLLDAPDGPEIVTLDELLPRNFGRPVG